MGVLTYHVVGAKVLSTDLSAGNVATVEGQSVAVSLDSGVMINDSTVTTADIEASNGVIHVIDKVLIPEGVLPEDEEMEDSSAVVFLSSGSLLLLSTFFFCF